MDKPWEDEVDYLDGEFSGMKYEVRRNLDTGSLCGYVVVPPGNLFNKAEDYDDALLKNIDIHGGWTYGEREENGDLTLGFDCAHSGDLVPMMAMMRDEIMQNLQLAEDTYRTTEYVEDQCKRACWQLTGNTFTDKLNEALYQRYANGK